MSYQHRHVSWLQSSQRRKKSRSIDQKVWQKYKDIVYDLYLSRNLTEKQVRDALASEYDFEPSKRQLVAQLGHWKFQKYRTAPTPPAQQDIACSECGTNETFDFSEVQAHLMMVPATEIHPPLCLPHQYLRTLAVPDPNHFQACPLPSPAQSSTGSTFPFPDTSDVGASEFLRTMSIDMSDLGLGTANVQYSFKLPHQQVHGHTHLHSAQNTALNLPWPCDNCESRQTRASKACPYHVGVSQELLTHAATNMSSQGCRESFPDMLTSIAQDLPMEIFEPGSDEGQDFPGMEGGFEAEMSFADWCDILPGWRDARKNKI